MPLDLPAEVLGHLMDRVEDLRGRLTGSQGGPLEVQCGLDDLGVGDARVAFLAELDLENRVL